MPYLGAKPTPIPLTSSDITDGIITTAKIADDAVDNTKLDLTSDYTLTGAFTSKGIDDNANSTAMTIDSSGKIGLGASTIDSDIHLEKSSDLEIKLERTGAGTSTISVPSSGVLEVNNTSNAGLNLKTNNTQRMQIGADGDVGMGTGSTSSYFLNVMNAPSRGVVCYFYATSGVGIYLSNGSNSWSTASDENIKENITELNKQKSYDNIKNIRAVNFNFKDVVKTDEDGKEVIHKDDTKRLGFIAQDWQKEYSETVVKDPENNLGLNYTETIPVLLSALQKAQEKIEALEARVTALENG